MNDLTVTVTAKIDARIFRDFSVFDTFQLKKRWKSPLLFALIMLGFAVLCFCQYKTAEQAVFIGSILLAVGFGLPVIHFVNFFRSINTQIRKLRLSEPQSFYTLTLTDVSGGIKVTANNGDTAQYDWDSVYGAYRKKDCTYLYVTINRAFLLPDRDAGDRLEALLSLLKKCVASGVVGV